MKFTPTGCEEFASSNGRTRIHPPTESVGAKQGGWQSEHDIDIAAISLVASRNNIVIRVHCLVQKQNLLHGTEMKKVMHLGRHVHMGTAEDYCILLL